MSSWAIVSYPGLRAATLRSRRAFKYSVCWSYGSAANCTNSIGCCSSKKSAGSASLGSGAGEGCNLNYAIRKETASASIWLDALDSALASIGRFAPDTLLVSLGVDAFHKDPFGGLGLIDTDFRAVGSRAAALGLPTLFVMRAFGGSDYCGSVEHFG